MATYTTYLFLPGHLSMWAHMINMYIFDNPESENIAEMDSGTTPGTL